MARTKTHQPQCFTTTGAQISLCLLFTFALMQALGQSAFNVTKSSGAPIFSVKNDTTIGIGTTDPRAQTHILESGEADEPAIDPVNAGTALIVQRSGASGAGAGIAILTASQESSFLNFGYADPEAGFPYGDDDSGSILYDHNSDQMQFRVNGSTRVTIDNTGRMGIAKTNPGYTLDVNGSVACVNDENCISDVRLKDNIAPIEGALDKVTQLNGIGFDWRSHDHSYINLDDKRHIGLVAQEVMAVFPEMVAEHEFLVDPEAEEEMPGSSPVARFYGISYGPMVAVLVEAIKEQQAIIASQRIEREALQTRMAVAIAALQQLGAWPPEEGNP